MADNIEAQRREELYKLSSAELVALVLELEAKGSRAN